MNLVTLNIFLFLSVLTFVSGFSQSSGIFTHKIIDQNPPSNIWIKCTGDFDKDGNIDLMIGGHEGRTRDLIIWYQNPGTADETWTKHTVYEGTDAYGFEVGATGDLDNDGDVDLVMGSYWQHKLFWLENQNEKTDQWKLHELGNPKSGTTYLRDFDNDGKLDIVTRASQKYSGEVGRDVWIWKQNSITSWTKYYKYIGDGEYFNIGDIDMDGKTDIVIANKWLRNNGNIDIGTWEEFTFTDAYQWLCTFPIVVDMNKDGRNDIVLTPTVWAGEYYKTAWYEAPKNQTTITWREHIIENNIECVTHALGIHDFDNNGILDVFTAEMHNSEDPDEVRIYYSQSIKGDSRRKSVISVSGSHSNQFFDFDGDGDIDILGGNHGGNFKPLIELWINSMNTDTRK
jgi:hypothetical protein